MQFNAFFTAIVSLACMGMGGAIAAAVPEAPTPSAVGFSKEAGCWSQGPLGTGTANPYIIAGCTPGKLYEFEVMDASGCQPGDVTNITSLEVDDLNLTVQYTTAASLNVLWFWCPSEAVVRCQVNLKAAADGPSYSLRVIGR